MARYFLLLVAGLFLAVGLLTVVPSPDRAPWQLAVLADNFGHWLALGSVGLVVAAWCARGVGLGWQASVTVIGVAAAALLLRPCWDAARIARVLPAELARTLGPAEVDARPFSVAALGRGDPGAVPVETHEFAPGLKLDFYRAIGRTPAPCVIVVHGGGWNGGKRTEIASLDRWLARQGYAVVAIDYRLAPAHRWPAQAEDVRAALAFVRAHAAAWGVDARKLVLFGRSAGGQIVEAVAYENAEPGVCGVVALYAPNDLFFGYTYAREDDVLKSPALLRNFLGGTPKEVPANYASASGLLHVTPAAPPTLLLHGELDTLVWYRHSVRLAARLRENGVRHALVSLPWATHAFEYNLAGPGGQITTFALAWFLADVTR
ncbi:alpha/beta hydrolase [Horticoccus luteus]|uniref:Alpha/beta hydrolase n=1 Tax=Horticoccus luteus TaxID=2862869 RepID=A0A8F9TWA1_9BACT|nr:alpha/beta hydrolase [Horticoccus luteus]QYM79176.1 alpha/beta hydrolase [Horticoccus luteus]